jgi:nucleoside-diphosphate-sugar epimerase
MTILVIGATGRVGRHVVQQLVDRRASVRVLTRDPFEGQVSGQRGSGAGRPARHRLLCAPHSMALAPCSCSTR